MNRLTYEFITLINKEKIILDVYFSNNIYWILSGTIQVIKMDNYNNLSSCIILGPHKAFQFLRNDRYYFVVKALSPVYLVVS
jgi:hypothetical protein